MSRQASDGKPSTAIRLKKKTQARKPQSPPLSTDDVSANG
jgi:hypothetical protein